MRVYLDEELFEPGGVDPLDLIPSTSIPCSHGGISFHPEHSRHWRPIRRILVASSSVEAGISLS